jgi:hypothetical protein
MMADTIANTEKAKTERRTGWFVGVVLKPFFFFLYFLFFIIIIYLCMTLVMRFFHVRQWGKPRTDWDLEKDGIQRFQRIMTEEDMRILRGLMERDETLQMQEYLTRPGSTLSDKVLTFLPPGYQFHDYVFYLKKSRFHTCHRDYNGDQFNGEQKHPSYTVIVYLTDMNRCLDVIPGSHQHREDNVNWTDTTQTVHCLTGDALLFDANLVHSGSLNDGDFPRVQMKISHRDDMETLDFYSDYHKVLNEENKTSPELLYLQKHLSCTFPIISEWTQSYDKNKDAGNSSGASTSLLSSIYAKLDNAT